MCERVLCGAMSGIDAHASADAVAVIGGGVVGCAVAHALARRGVRALVLEAQAELATGASATNSGILHTGFDSGAGELETRLILRAAQLREELLDELGLEVWRCGARLRPRDDEERTAVAGRVLREPRNRSALLVIARAQARAAAPHLQAQLVQQLLPQLRRA